MIPCPDCEHTGHKGKVEKTLYQRFGGTLEPVGGWIEDERPESCGGGPSEHFHWVMHRDPCPKCKPDEEEDDG